MCREHGAGQREHVDEPRRPDSWNRLHPCNQLCIDLLLAGVGLELLARGWNLNRQNMLRRETEIGGPPKVPAREQSPRSPRLPQPPPNLARPPALEEPPSAPASCVPEVSFM